MKCDAAIVGGGIVGLATAYYLSAQHPDKRLIVLEKEPAIALHQTGRNSGVIHSGIYYVPGSLKAENCRVGRDALVDFCRAEGITHEICGKVIVATDDTERPRLKSILERGRENGVRCELVSREELREREPHCAGVEAIHVPDAGIVDFKGMSRRLAEIVKEGGHDVRTSTEVLGFARTNGAVQILTSKGEVQARTVVNCAGLYSDRLARLSGVEPGVQIVPFRGEYFELTESARHLCKNLIYPVPDPAYPFLGVHFTRMFDGRVECGPSAVLAFAREGYRFSTLDMSDLAETIRYRGFRRLVSAHWRMGAGELLQSLSKRRYLQSLHRLIPDVGIDDLLPAPSGVRAQAVRNDGSMADDFLILESEHFVNVCNAPSPAATASLNIGRLIGQKVEARF